MPQKSQHQDSNEPDKSNADIASVFITVKDEPFDDWRDINDYNRDTNPMQVKNESSDLHGDAFYKPAIPQHIDVPAILLSTASEQPTVMDPSRCSAVNLDTPQSPESCIHSAPSSLLARSPGHAKRPTLPIDSCLLKEKQRRLDTSTEITHQLEDLHNDGFDFLEDEHNTSDCMPSDTDDALDEDVHSDEEVDPISLPWEGVMETFSWRAGDNCQPDFPEYSGDEVGVTSAFPVVNDNAREIDYFQAFFDSAFMGFLCERTNMSQKYKHDRDPTPSSGKMQRWHDTSVGELYVFFALLMLMGHIRKHVLKEYWILNDITATPVFAKYMPRDRFLSLLRFLHFADNSHPNGDDRFWEIRECFTMLKERFAKFFHPFQRLVLDGSFTLIRGRLAFRQYIPSRRHRSDTKIFVLYDCETGYVLDMMLCTAGDADHKNDSHGFSAEMVKKMMDRYLGGKHILYTDDYKTTPSLTEFLLEKNRSCGPVATEKEQQQEFAKVIHGEGQLQKANKMLAICRQDKHAVNIQAINQNSGKMDKGKPVMKPETALDYGVRICQVDKSDLMVGSIECVRRTVKWYKRMFLHLMDITVLNSYNLYVVKTSKKVSLRIFSKRLIEQILETYGVVQKRARGHSQAGLPDRLLGRDYISRHFLEALPPTAGKPKAQRQCHVCKNTTKRAGRRKDVTTWCKECGVALCISCFKEYHTLKIY
ncbi:piggyBac transposable element-derived protein 4 [Penaeus vannamei]|uniref:piggyBac transposable element-derived protein 4 n=1 Tax=Penaeus vannamei TaxID=6689 RepID=UPI00387F4704